MELFTLGAGRGYTERRRPRAGARAHRLAQRLGRRGRPARFRFDRDTPRRGHQAGLRQARRASTGATRAGCASSTASTRRSSSEAVVLLHPDAAAARDPAALERLYMRERYAIRPVVEAILRHPDVLRAARGMVKPPVVYIAGLLRVRRARRRHRVVALARGLCGPAPVPSAERRRAGRTTRWLDTATWRGRWMTANEVGARARGRPEHADRYGGRTETPRAGGDKALAFWGNPTVGADTRPAARVRRAAARPARTSNWQARDLSRPAPERAADADRDLPDLHDELTMPTGDCLRRLHARRGAARAAAAPRGARARRDRSARMPRPAGTGIDRRSSCCARRRRDVGVRGVAARARPARARGGRRRRGRRPADARARDRVHRGRHRLALGARARRATRSYRRLRPKLALGARQRHAVHARTPRCAGIPSAAAAGDPARRGQGSA